MEMNRAKVKNNVWQGTAKTTNLSKAKSPLSRSAIAAAVHGSRARRADNSGSTSSKELWAIDTGVKV
ncbi:unnamed protein product [Phytophthora fragariaefolia]|uniref:Unnamed protein product n=1 Tax=Phytophthora fragariaefolia TaxID=1490495 RepID=A0A9W6WUX6_9STRA|nr:unnamed protein product [Phytophthora fragariaefolia]